MTSFIQRKPRSQHLVPLMMAQILRRRLAARRSVRFKMGQCVVIETPTFASGLMLFVMSHDFATALRRFMGTFTLNIGFAFADVVRSYAASSTIRPLCGTLKWFLNLEGQPLRGVTRFLCPVEKFTPCQLCTKRFFFFEGVLCRPRDTRNEVGLYLLRKMMLCHACGELLVAHHLNKYITMPVLSPEEDRDMTGQKETSSVRCAISTLIPASGHG